MGTVTREGAGALALGLMLLASTCAANAQAQEPAVPNPPTAIPNAPSAAEVLPHERSLSLRHHWTREELTIVYRIGNGYQAEALAQFNWLLRDYRCNRYTEMDPKLFDLLYELQQELKPGGPIRIVSAYRSEGYNASLLRAGRTVDPDSQHTQGRAVDVIFPGVPPDRVRAAAEAKGLGGVGYYPFSGPVFVHVDTGPLRHWVERDPKVSRALGVPARRRARLSLDCTLTTERVLEEISPERAYAALPPGAASKPHPAGDLVQTSLADGAPAFRRLGSSADATPATSHNGDGPACIGGDPLSRLSLLPPASERAGSSKIPAALTSARTQLHAKKLLKQKVRGQLKQKVKRQLKVARRARSRANHAALGNRGTMTPSNWEKSPF
jgi:uncharacterized protein YcbK (DUF882 family)